MNKSLSYLNQKTVIEYLDANQRIQLSTSRTSLRKLERQLPLRIESLACQKFEIIINGTAYKLKSTFSLWRGFETMEKMADFLLSRREKILVKTMSFGKVDYLDNVAKLRIESLECYHFNFQAFASVLHPSCYPLKQLKCYVRDGDELDYCQATNRLAILNEGHSTSVQHILTQQEIPHINLEGFRLSLEQLGNVVRAWIAQGREIGTRLTMYHDEEYKVLRGLKRDFDGKRALLASGSTRRWTDPTCDVLRFNQQATLVTYTTDTEIRVEIVTSDRPYAGLSRESKTDMLVSLFAVWLVFLMHWMSIAVGWVY